jgi:putative endonuclease
MDSRFRGGDMWEQGNFSMKQFYVYLLASRKNGKLYVGMTSDLPRRVQEHRDGVGSIFASKYGVRRLVWFEIHEDAMSAITREKQIKKWRRNWKIELIEAENQNWDDLAERL